MESKPPHLCVAICERSIKALQSAGTTASDAGDLVELRLDCLDEDDFNSGADRLKKLVHNLSVPTIVTYRPAEQGGSSNANVESRYAFGPVKDCRLGRTFAISNWTSPKNSRLTVNPDPARKWIGVA